MLFSLGCLATCGGGDAASNDPGSLVDVAPVMDTADPVDPGAPDPGNPEPDLAPIDTGPVYKEYKGKPDGFIKGGLLANYYAGAASTPDNLPAEHLDWSLEPVIDLTDSNQAFSQKNNGDLFTVRMKGAIHIEEDGVYRLITTASDSVRIKLHGDTVIQVWQIADLVTKDATFELTKGWHPIEIVYVRDVYRAHLQFWLAKQGEAPVIGDTTNLGFGSSPIPSNGLNGEAEIIEVASWGARIQLQANAPVIVSTNAHPGGFHLDIEEYNTEHVWTVHLPADGSYELKIEIWDLWGRSIVVPTLSIQTEPVPDYVEGGLLGTYFNKTNFTNETGKRFDPRIYLPEDVGDGRQDQSFGMYMNNNNFSIRWEGAVKTENPGEYTFFVGSDDGRRFWINGEQVVEFWSGTPLSYDEATVYLGPGWQPIKFEMYEGGGLADAKLEWRRPDGVHEIIPSENLGTLLPEEDPSTVPVISNLEASVNDAENNDNDAIQYKWKTNVLSTCTLSLQGLDSSTTIQFDAPSNGFKFRYMVPPYGIITATVYVNSMYGVSGQSDNVVVDSPTEFVPLEE
jgi:hypothetical protein